MVQVMTDRSHNPWIPVSCQEATRLLSDSMERRLSLRETVLLKTHLFVCDLCQRFDTHIRGLRKLLRAYTPAGEQTLSPESKIRLKETLKGR